MVQIVDSDWRKWTPGQWRAARVLVRLSQSDLAMELGLTQKGISRLETRGRINLKHDDAPERQAAAEFLLERMQSIIQEVDRHGE